jgi:hypothetical protein
MKPMSEHKIYSLVNVLNAGKSLLFVSIIINFSNSLFYGIWWDMYWTTVKDNLYPSQGGFLSSCNITIQILYIIYFCVIYYSFWTRSNIHMKFCAWKRNNLKKKYKEEIIIKIIIIIIVIFIQNFFDTYLSQMEKVYI